MQPRQYTIRNLSRRLDETLRKKSRESGKSLNEIVLDVLHQGAGLGDQPLLHHDLDHLIGSWKEDPKFEEALRLQDQVDRKIWS